MVGNDVDLRRELFNHFHNGSLEGHLGSHATKVKMVSLLYWKGLSRGIKQWVRECRICQKCKANLVDTPSLIQPLPILM